VRPVIRTGLRIQKRQAMTPRQFIDCFAGKVGRQADHHLIGNEPALTGGRYAADPPLALSRRRIRDRAWELLRQRAGKIANRPRQRVGGRIPRPYQWIGDRVGKSRSLDARQRPRNIPDRRLRRIRDTYAGRADGGRADTWRAQSR
jgi:hypothetical protein